MTLYLDLSSYTSSLVSLLATTKDSAFLIYSMFISSQYIIMGMNQKLVFTISFQAILDYPRYF